MNTQNQSQSASLPDGVDHQDWQRLWLAAKTLNKHVETQADLARLLNVSAQDITNWKRRGVPKDKIVQFAQAVGCRAEWLGTGKGDMVGSSLDRLFVELPQSVKESTLDYIQFQIQSSAHKLIAGEKIASYNTWIQAVRSDMTKLKKE